jgi:hypothetical protein
LEEGALIDGFALFYQYRSAMLAHAEHVFDDEFAVQDELSALGELHRQPVLKSKFVRSVDSPFTQILDVVAGLFSKYFDFLDQNTPDRLVAARADLTSQQLETLHLIKSLIEKIDDECNICSITQLQLASTGNTASSCFPAINRMRRANVLAGRRVCLLSYASD